ncbi:hypothetical protein [Desulfocicer niacini]
MDRRVVILPDGRGVLAENGPMRMTIQARRHGRSYPDLAMEAAGFAFTCLEEVAMYRNQLMHREPRMLSFFKEKNISIPYTMVESVLALDEPDLTPMAAVAGTLADAVADWLFQREMTQVIVDNGGDIAIRLAGTEMARVGIRTDIKSPLIAHVMALDARHASWGVNTSGLGGRSLTRGIASAVTVLSHTSSLADAAATALANACFFEDEGILQLPARLLDSATDIPDVPVTVRVGSLHSDTCMNALSRALQRAEHYVQRGVILGAFIATGGKESWTRHFSEHTASLN